MAVEGVLTEQLSILMGVVSFKMPPSIINVFIALLLQPLMLGLLCLAARYTSVSQKI